METVTQTAAAHKIVRIAAPAPAPRALPESPCSVNVFFEIAGYGRAQATGRGNSAEEAAANLQHTVLETKKALEAPPVVSREARLGALLTCGMKKAVAKQDFGMVERLSKAVALVLAGKVEPGEREGMLAVRSLKDEATWYEVEGTSCTCPDYKHRHQAGEKTYYCKHALAGMMFAKLA